MTCENDSMSDTFPGSHLVEKDGGLIFRKGAWFVSLENAKGKQEEDTWVVHKLAKGDSCNVNSESETVIEMFTAECGRFTTDGGYETSESENYRGWPIDKSEDVERFSASFCPKCFPVLK